ncbi:two-component sensor histidine kinase [Vibrio navarrensis]|nr:ATP-binding protein [Vibrio navarrensis]MBE3669150.1 two-component sensor histidine kinase [Vibrio navarrensis]
MKKHKVFSIKRRLTLSVVLLSCALILLSLYFSFSAAQDEVEEVYDARLGQAAKQLLMATALSAEHLARKEQREHFDEWMENIQRLSHARDDIATAFGHPYEQNILFQFYRDDELIFSSDSQQAALSLGRDHQGFGDVQTEGHFWRIFQLAQPHSQRGYEYVLVAEKQHIRDEAINEIALSTALPQLVLIPCLVLLMIVLIDRNFRPIHELKSAIAVRSVHKLDRIYVREQTAELTPLVETLNELLEQLEQAWQREKRFTRMAAHELKTPLTVLRLNAENALHSQNPEELKHDLGMILKGIDRTDRLIHQLLTLAKVESLAELTTQQVELSALIRQVIANLAPLAIKQQQQLSFEGEKYWLEGDEILLGVLFKNLIDNAIRYSGTGSEIEVQLTIDTHGAQVTVADSGQAIKEEVREKMFDNFYRANTEKGDGAGLGMSICRDIAQRHETSVELLAREGERNVFCVRFSSS